MRKSRRLAEVGAVLATIAILPATILILWLSGWYANLGGAPARADALVGELEGRVWTVEPMTSTIHVSSKPLGIGAIAVVVTDGTRVLVGDKEGAFGDLHEGMRVRVAYERRHDARFAWSVALLGARGPRRSPAGPD